MAINIDRHGFHNILVDVDALEERHAALEAAIGLARYSRSKIKIVDCLGQIPAKARSFLTPQLEQELVDDRRARLERLAYWRCHGLPVETAVLRGVAGVELVREVVRSGHDLLVRAYDRDLPRDAPSSSPVDVSLLRTCPCPVWFVRSDRGASAPHIVAAVDTSSDDPAEQALNRRIVELAARLREARQGDLTVLHAWHAADASENVLQQRMGPHAYADVYLRAERTAYERTAALLLSCGDRLGDARLKIVRGEPEDVIPAVGAELHADVLVMGSMVRKELAGFFMGNTAERVLCRWPGSVMVVKPLGAASPLAVGEPRARAQTQRA
jgi:universal stress protein E